MSRRILLRHASLGALALAMVTASDAVAQSSSSSGASAVIEEVVVTARKREENLQNVPVAVTAITSEQLRDATVNNPYDLADMTPGLEIRSGSSNRSSVDYFIRGQGVTFGAGPAVVTYFADVPGGGGNVQFFDLASVQVLKGPQGTLFGRSSTGGAVLYQPKRPGDEFDGYVEVTGGGRDHIEVEGAVTIPVIEDKFSLRVAGHSIRDRGFTLATTTGQYLDSKKRYSYRVAALIKPTAWLENYTLFHGTRVNESASGQVLNSFNPNIPQWMTGPGQVGRLTVTTICNSITPAGAARDACIAQRIARLDDLRNSGASEFARLQAGGSIRRTLRRFPTIQRNHNQAIINTTTVDFGDVPFLGNVTAKNVLSFSRLRYSYLLTEICGVNAIHCIQFNGYDLVNSQPTIPSQLTPAGNDFDDAITEEFQLAGDFGGDHSWLLGYFTSRNKSNASLPPIFPSFNNAFSIPFDTYAFLSNRSGGGKSTQDGYFGQVTIDTSSWLLEGLKVTGGLRWSKSTSHTLTLFNVVTPQGLTSGAVQRVSDFSEGAWTWNASLDYQLNPDTLIYAAHRRGFKPGGFNGTALGVTGVPGLVLQYSPETVDDVELGGKVTWGIGDIRIRSNVAAYYMWYKGIQRTQQLANPNPPFGTFTQTNNIGAARIYGLEFENQVQLTETLGLRVNYSHINAKYTRYPGSTRNTDGVLIPNIESPYTGTPKHAGSIGIRYDLPVDEEIGTVTAGVDYSLQSGVWLDDSAIQDPTTLGFQKAYDNLNLRLDWRNIAGHPVDAGFSVKNVFNDEWKVGVGNLLATLGTSTATWNEPRTWALEVRYRFGASGG